METFDTILTPLYWVVSWMMRFFHTIFSVPFDPDSGIAWALTIMGLVVTMRIILIPLFVRQIKASRNMAVIQPKVKELQKKYGHDREKMGQELMKLYKDSGTNPFASCLPILAQSPIFISLFRVLDGAANGHVRGSGLNKGLVDSLANAHIFGATIADKFIGADTLNVQVVTVVLILCMTATTFTTQRQLMRKNMPPEALTGQFAQQQKLLLYVLPLVFAIGGVNFPIGVLIYWFTTNLWTMGQQFWVIRRNPAPGSPAYDAWQERKKKKALRKGEPVEEEPAPAAANGTSGGAKSGGDSGGKSKGKAQASNAKAANGKASGGSSDSAAKNTSKRVQPQRVPRSKRKSGRR